MVRVGSESVPSAPGEVDYGYGGGLTVGGSGDGRVIFGSKDRVTGGSFTRWI